MPVFEFQALDASGARVRGRMEALSPAAVVARLQEHGHLPIEAHEVAGQAASAAREAPRPWRRAVGGREVAGFFRALAALLAAGHPLDRALGVLEETVAGRRFARAIAAMRAKVRAGQPLSAAVEECPEAFTGLDANILRAGEASGALTLVLERLAGYRERAQALRETVLGALYYPAIVIGVAVMALVLLLTYVVPQFEQLFAEAHAALPRPTEIVIAAGRILREDGWAILLGAACLLLLYERAMRRTALRRMRDRLLLRTPVLGRLVADAATARLAETLETMLVSGLELPAALALARGVVESVPLAEDIDRALLGVREGRHFSEALAASGLYPRLAVSMLRVGEESGNLATAAAGVASFFSARLERALKRLLVLLEPALILLVGLLVGGIIFSIIIAVIRVNELAS